MDLHQLTETKIVTLSPTIKKVETLSNGDVNEYQVPVYEEYGTLLKAFELPDMTLMDSEEKDRAVTRVRERRLGVFGSDIDFRSPDRYQEIGMLRELNLWHVWPSMPIYEKAEIIAEYRLSQMSDFIRRCHEYDEQQRKQKAKKSNGTPQ